jgi:hypothetical protein
VVRFARRSKPSRAASWQIPRCRPASLLDAAVDAAWEPCEQAAIDLINTLLLDTGGDAQDTMGVWIDAFLDTLADAVGAMQEGAA